MQARCGSRKVPVVWRRPGGRFKAKEGGFGVVWCRPGVRFKEGSGGSGGLERLAVGDTT